ncbi:MAG: YeeE/YedE thiosulfate transporter family protein [Desulfobacterota bacterium]|nr:YeeE/YedE thiosulfate transporter family protein [Thermodesulfobacteriota bacterium]
MGQLVLGLITGILFGFLLQKGQALRYDRQIGVLLLRDFTILKIMVSAVLVGMVGVYFFVDMGWGKLSVKPLVLGANVIGGLLFGLGWGLLGYCPGTAVGATGEGRWDAFWGGVLGMLVGAGLFAEAYPLVKDSLLKWGDHGKMTLPKLLGIHHWVLIPILWALLLSLLLLIEKKKA